MLTDLTPLVLDAWIRLLQEKCVERTCTITVYMFSYHTLQSLFAKLVETAIMHQYRNVHPNDSLYEDDLPIPDALEPPLLQLST